MVYNENTVWHRLVSFVNRTTDPGSMTRRCKSLSLPQMKSFQRSCTSALCEKGKHLVLMNCFKACPGTMRRSVNSKWVTAVSEGKLHKIHHQYSFVSEIKKQIKFLYSSFNMINPLVQITDRIISCEDGI
jgi:hypothetical protein